MFKVKNKNTFIPFSSVSIVAFEQVSWEVLGLLRALYRIHRGTLQSTLRNEFYQLQCKGFIINIILIFVFV